MPNWVEGNIRIRGTKTNIEDFLKNEIVYIATEHNACINCKEKKPIFEKDYHGITIYHPDAIDSFYVRNTIRNFFFANQVEVSWLSEEKDEAIAYIDHFNAAWSFKETGWIDHAVKYGVDFKMFGFEQGMEFSQIMTILKDGTTNIETKEYDDWAWDCPFPYMGG